MYWVDSKTKDRPNTVYYTHTHTHHTCAYCLILILPYRRWQEKRWVKHFNSRLGIKCLMLCMCWCLVQIDIDIEPTDKVHSKRCGSHIKFYPDNIFCLGGKNQGESRGKRGNSPTPTKVCIHYYYHILLCDCFSLYRLIFSGKQMWVMWHSNHNYVVAIGTMRRQLPTIRSREALCST